MSSVHSSLSHLPLSERGGQGSHTLRGQRCKPPISPSANSRESRQVKCAPSSYTGGTRRLTPQCLCRVNPLRSSSRQQEGTPRPETRKALALPHSQQPSVGPSAVSGPVHARDTGRKAHILPRRLRGQNRHELTTVPLVVTVTSYKECCRENVSTENAFPGAHTWSGRASWRR